MGPFPDQSVNSGGLTVIDLEERGGGDAQPDFPQAGNEVGKAENLQGLPAKDDIPGRGVEILMNGNDFRNFALQPFGKRIQFSIVAFGGDEGHHDLGAFRSDFYCQIAEQSSAGLGVENKNILALNFLANHLGHLVEERVVKRAFADVHDIVAATTVEAEVNPSPFLGKNQLGAGSVPQGFRAARISAIFIPLRPA